MIDARGLGSPMPVLMLQKAMKSKDTCYEVLVDSESSCEAVRKFAESQGCNVEIENRRGTALIRIRTT